MPWFSAVSKLGLCEIADNIVRQGVFEPGDCIRNKG
jgi:hypothetical protein